VGRRLRRAGIKARVVQLKIKYADFEVITRRRTLAEPEDDGQRLYREALALLAKVPRDRKIRLTGVSGQELTGGSAQLGLFAKKPRRAEKLNAALDRIADRFGSAAITTADLVGADDRMEEDDDEARRRIDASKLDAPDPGPGAGRKGQ
jgi:DNA polymerase-4